MHSTLVSKSSRFSEEFSLESKAKNLLHFTIGKPKFSSGELTYPHLQKTSSGVKTDNKSF